MQKETHHERQTHRQTYALVSDQTIQKSHPIYMKIKKKTIKEKLVNSILALTGV
jgi:hypothetical protein